MTGDGYEMIAYQLNRISPDLICPPFHDVDLEIPEYATSDEQKYLHKFRKRMLMRMKHLLNTPGEIDQASNLWLGRNKIK